MQSNSRIVGVALAATMAMAPPAGAQARTVGVELNRLEQVDGSCRGYFVFRNGFAEPVETLDLDVFLFDAEGVIRQRVALASGRLEPGKTHVRIFELPDIACDDIGRVLLSDVMECGLSGGDGCGPAVEVSSRAGVPFED